MNETVCAAIVAQNVLMTMMMLPKAVTYDIDSADPIWYPVEPAETCDADCTKVISGEMHCVNPKSLVKVDDAGCKGLKPEAPVRECNCGDEFLRKKALKF